MPKEKYNPEKEARAAKRRSHFANGGDLATWRGRPARFKDKKKEANKKKAREKIEE